ncbi:UDP-glucose 4-epimerase GalE [Myxococcota bacterium]|nr:UDP-glucose 4-epimerase GalE [Myxococcota bacterium]
MTRLLVTGGAGYVGSHALRTLRQAGHEAVVLDDLRAGFEDAVQGAPLVRADVGDPIALGRVFAEHGPFDGVLHFAASISVPESVALPLRYYRNNMAASAVLIDTALAHDVRAFVLSSTAAVYGSSDVQPIVEDVPLCPENPYGASKLMIERMLADAGRAHRLSWMALRYFNASGADPDNGLGERHDPETHLIPLALEAAAGLRPALQIFGSDWPTPDGTCIRDYIHVRDLADAHRLGIEALLAGGEGGCFNLGTGGGHSIRAVLASVERVTGRPVPVQEAARRPGDPAVLVADSRRFRDAFGWTPRHSELDTIVGNAWDWLRRWRGL